MSEEQALFNMLQDYTISVFNDCLLEAKAFNLVCHYLGKAAGSKEGDAHLLYHYALTILGPRVLCPSWHIFCPVAGCQGASWTQWFHLLCRSMVHQYPWYLLVFASWNGIAYPYSGYLLCQSLYCHCFNWNEGPTYDFPPVLPWSQGSHHYIGQYQLQKLCCQVNSASSNNREPWWSRRHGDGRSQGRSSGRGNPASRDVTDSNVGLSHAQYQALNPD